MLCNNKKGDLGVTKVMSELIEKGFDICLPITDNLPFDLIAHKDNNFIKVQVKYRKLTKTGRIIVNLNKHSDILYAIYLPDMDKCLYVDPIDFNCKISIAKLNYTFFLNIPKRFKNEIS